MLDSIPDPATWWRKKPMVDMTGLTPWQVAIFQKAQLAKQHPELRQFPLLVHQGDVPTHQVGSPTPAAAYQPVPVQKTDNIPSVHNVVHNVEGPTFTAQGEVRDAVLHPMRHLGYTLTNHPVVFAENLWQATKQGMGWVVYQYSDFFKQLQGWDGSWIGFTRTAGLFWRGLIVAALTVGMVEIAPLLNSLATWVRLVFDFIRGALGLVGDAVDELWWLLTRLWNDITGLVV